MDVSKMPERSLPLAGILQPAAMMHMYFNSTSAEDTVDKHFRAKAGRIIGLKSI